MTAILGLRLSHFRSYRASELQTGGGSVALFGPNGAGKTNVLEAASLLVPGRGLRRAGTDELIRRPERLGWKIVADLATPDGEVAVETAADGPDATRRSVTIDDKPAPQTALGGLVRQVWLTPAMDRLWTDAAGDRRRFLDRMTLGFTPGHAETALDYEKAMRERNRLLREDRHDPAWLDALEGRMARAGARIARARAEALTRLQAAQEQAPEGQRALFPRAEMTILGAMEDRFSRVIRAGSESPGAGRGGADGDTGRAVIGRDGAPDAADPDAADLDAAEIDEAAGLARALEDGRARDAAAGRTLLGPHRSDLDAVYAAKAMPARACSTGEQKALLISLCLANARALAATGPAPVLLMDEVAAHLDAERRRALYAEIAALGCQAFATGTAEALFDGFEARRVAVREDAGVSRLDAA